MTGRKFHVYPSIPTATVNPGLFRCTADSGFLADKPQFADVVDELLDFIDGAELLIHNASLSGLPQSRAELPSRTGRIEDQCAVLDTLTLARQLHPGQRNFPDALCKR